MGRQRRQDLWAELAPEDSAPVSGDWTPVSRRDNIRVIATLVAVVVAVAGAAWWFTRPETAPAPTPPPAAAPAPLPPPTSSSPEASSTSPPAATVSGDPQGICEHFAQAYLAVDTTRDPDESAARVRAAQAHGTPALRDRMRQSQTRPTARWRELATHQAHIETEPQPYVGDQPPPDRAGTRYRAVSLGVRAVGEAWSKQLAPTVVYCTLQPHDGQWRVADVEASVSGAPR